MMLYTPKAGSNENMLKKILESIYEANFLDNSYGFRPGRNFLQAIRALDRAVMYKPTVHHKWLMKCLRERITDPNLLWLIKRFLKAGIVEAGQYEAAKQGTRIPLSGIVSPILSNLYLHHVLDLWFEKEFKPNYKGYIELIRFCDDFVVCCENEADAKELLEALKQRLSKFGLEIAENKS